jgi:cholinesterase
MTPVLDGTFLKRLPSESFAKNLVADVAILAGSNTDEGTATFFGPRYTLNTDADVHALLAGMGNGLDNATIAEAMALYPDDPAQGCPFNTGDERFAENGYMYKRGAAIIGDEVIHAGRRFTTEYYSSHTKSPVYSYRFDQTPWNGIEVLVATEAPVYSTHYSEVGAHYPVIYNSYRKLIHLMRRSASFLTSRHSRARTIPIGSGPTLLSIPCQTLSPGLGYLSYTT